jgi:hypothetical protein
MKKIVSFIVVLAFLLGSCVSSNIRSNKSPDFNEKITKLFIIGKVGEKAKYFYSALATNFVASLKEKGIEVRTFYVDPLSLDSDEDMTKRIALYDPNLVMIINQTESRENVNGFGFGGGFTIGGTFDIKMFQPNSKNPVWRANLKADSSVDLKDAAKNANKKLVEKLIEDKLLD